MTPGNVDLAGLFPSFEAEAGGVQMSGRIGWEGVLQMGWDNPVLLSYGRNDAGDNGASGPRLDVTSKAGALRAATRIGGRRSIVLVWHLGLVKLLPFLRISSPRVAVFLHGIEAWRRLDTVTRRLLKRADLILTNSDHTWARFKAFNPGFESSSHRTVHLGVEAPLREATVAPDAPPAALMLARLARREDYKGHRETISAWPGVLSSLPDAELWIAGDGDLRPHLETLSRRLGVSHRVRFLGHVSEDVKADLLSRSRCLALPSRGEGFGLVYVEAMRVGRPCLVGDADAGREVVAPPEAGLAVDPGSPPQIAAAVHRLLADEVEWGRLSVQARARYEGYFTESHFQARLRAALETF